jgi:hypothetical protein
VEEILIINLFSSFFLCGLIWMVQLVHYPSFHGFDKDEYSEWITFHKQRISVIVIPAMLVELVTSLLLVFGNAPFPVLQLAGLGIVISIWLITFFVQVPLHERLTFGYQKKVADRLITSNWWRTLLWSLKSALGLYLISQLV